MIPGMQNLIGRIGIKPLWRLLTGTVVRLVAELKRRRGFLLVSAVLLYPVWVLPLLHIFPFHAFLLRDISPEMTLQEEYLTTAWNCWIGLFFLQGHPEAVEAYAHGIAYYRTAGRPDLAMRVKVVGSILVGWGFSSKIFAVTAFPFFLLAPYLPLRHRTKQLLKAALIILCLYIFMVFPSMSLA